MALWIGFLRKCSLAFSSVLANKSQGEMFAYDPLRSDREGDGEGENLEKNKKHCQYNYETFNTINHR